jgi:hypothetical protein
MDGGARRLLGSGHPAPLGRNEPVFLDQNPRGAPTAGVLSALLSAPLDLP